MMKDLNLDAGILAGLDEELKVPRAWMDGARKEGKLRIFSTWDPPQAEEILGPFKERYPFLSITYNRASHEDRAIKTVMAYKQGRIVTDVITGLGGSFFLYRDAGALEDMRDIPNLKNNLPKTQDPSGQWVGMHMRCPRSGRTFSPTRSGGGKTWRWATVLSSGPCSSGR